MEHSHVRLVHHLTLALVSFLLIIILAALIFRCVRHKSAGFRDPRRRADRAARREERRNRKLYKRAACKHKFSKWWNRCRHQHSAGDYEEKREMILEQEGLLDDVMQNEIRNLRTAHDLVRDLVRAEEGRARLHIDAAAPFMPTDLEAGLGSSSRDVAESLPSYAAPPPRYEEELAGDLTVVDGFRYVPSSTDDTPESSVIDCSPRLSFETGRTTLTREP